MKQESVNTGNGTTATLDPDTLPVPLEPEIKRQTSHLSTTRGRTSRKKAFNTDGLACLASIESISIEVVQNCLSCRLDKNYNVRDVKADRVILKGEQDFNVFDFDGLRNVILRDTENLPIARVCFKQKSSLYSSMAIKVYAPIDVMVGTGEETSGLFMFSSKLLLRNSDGDEIFNVEYFNKIFSSYFQIKSVDDDTGPVAKIANKSRHHIRLLITSKMSIINKLILISYCIALINKFTPPNKPID